MMLIIASETFAPSSEWVDAWEVLAGSGAGATSGSGAGSGAGATSGSGAGAGSGSGSGSGAGSGSAGSVVGSSAAGSSWSPQETKPKGSKIAAANGSIVVSFISLIFNFD